MSAALSEQDQRTLLRLAREAIQAAVNGQPAPAIDLQALSPALTRPGACFVTLTKSGELRGCIGGLEAEEPLALDVQRHAVQTALFDYRFPPVAPQELGDIDIEISVLTESIPLPYDRPAELLTKLRPGVDGVVLKKDQRRATFLPQVWERVPDPALFLSMLCNKMGAPEDEWLRGEVEVEVYEVEKFAETRRW